MINQERVFVIIVTYNAMKWVDCCLGSLRKSEMPVTTVVIDNLSKDETVRYIRQNYPEVHLIINSDNKGFGQANNQGIEWAYKEGASHFFLLNQDAWVHPNTIGELVSVQEKYYIPLVSPIHLNGAGERMDNGFYLFVVERDKNIQMVSDFLLNTQKDYYTIKSGVNAAAWMMSRTLVETIGGFDPVFFHYGEDMNYLQRMYYHKQQIAVVPKAIIHHDRINYGNKKVYKRNSTLRFLTIRGADINHSLFFIDKNIIKSDLSIIITFLKYIFTLRFGRAFSIVSNVFKYWFSISDIVKSRQTNKSIGPHWLNLSGEVN